MEHRTTRMCVCAIALLIAWSGFDEAAAASQTVCDRYARSYSENASRQGQVLGGGVIGGLIGLGIGVATGGAAVGLAVGGGIGMIGGGAKRRRTADRMYGAAFQDCMAGRIR